MAKVTTPNGKDLGEVTDPAWLAYYRRRGYTVVDGKKADDSGDGGMPKGNAGIAAWQEYAQAQGATAEEIDGLTRDQLREKYGSAQ